MGLSISLLSLAPIQVASDRIVGFLEVVEGVMVKSISLGADSGKTTLRSIGLKRSISSIKQISDSSSKEVSLKSSSFKYCKAKMMKLETVARSRNQDSDGESNLRKEAVPVTEYTMCSPELISPRPRSELDAAAIKVQKTYKGYRTRRNLADCAVVVEELWWKALDFASLKQSSISFFNGEKHETALSRWSRARTRVAKVGKGLSKSDNAQKLALRHWLEAIDPRHRYGHNLHLYYDVWFTSESTQPFFYWLDVGDGKEVNIEKCPRNTLQNQCIKYLGPNERKAYEVIVENGKLVYKQSKLLVNTSEDSKWIFVLSTLRALYVGKKKKGKFQHSSFLAGGAISAAGRLVVNEGILKVIWPYSGHYLPTEEHFKEFIKFLEDNGVDLTDVKRSAIDDDEYPSFNKLKYETEKEVPTMIEAEENHIQAEAGNLSDAEEEDSAKESVEIAFNLECNSDQAFPAESDACLSRSWSGAGPRIRCVRDYPTSLQCMALEQVNLSPRSILADHGNKDPIPSPRPSPRLRISPSLAYMGISSQRSPLHYSKQRLQSSWEK